MKLAVFGGTGRTGQHLIQQALDAGHEVIALARTPSKIAAQHPHLSVVHGDIRNAADVEKVIAGADAVISVLGPSSNKPEFAVSRGMSNILAAMTASGVKRLVMSTGAGVPDPNDAPKLFNHVMSAFLRLISKNVLEDMLRSVELVRTSEVNWTIVRVPMLTDNPNLGIVRVGYVGKGTGARLSRADMAAFILKQVEDGAAYLRQAPVISN